MHYTTVEPREGFSPQSAFLPNVELEAAGEVDWQASFGEFCLRHRLALAGPETGQTRLLRPGPVRLPGGALLPGFFKTSNWNFIAIYVSSGHPKCPGG